MPRTKERLAVFVSHPIQYFAPLWRTLASSDRLSLVVHFFSDISVRGGEDPGFGVPVAWDVPLLAGFEHRFLSRDADISRPSTVRLSGAEDTLQAGGFSAVMVHGYSYAFERQVVRAAVRLGLPTLMRGEFSDEVPDRGRSWMKAVARRLYLRSFYRSIDRFCAIGNEASEHLRRAGVSRDRIFFSPYSVDTALLDRQGEAFDGRLARHELGIPQDHLVVLFSGKLIPRKAPLLLAEALGQLEPHSRVWAIVMGDGEQRDEVREVFGAAIGNKLTLPGFVNQSQIGRYFKASDVLVLPSTYETWGLVVNEAMQFGLPAIVSDRCGCRLDLIVEGETGWVFPSGNAGALAQRLQRMVNNRDRAKEMGQAARHRVAGYTTEASAKGVVEALASITNNRQTGLQRFRKPE